MKWRWVCILLLGGLLVYTSGAAMVLHQAVAHASHDDAHDHDVPATDADCGVCHLLAAKTFDRVDPSCHVVSLQALPTKLVVSIDRPVIDFAPRLAQPRAPPIG